MSATMADCEAAKTQQSNEGGGDALQCFPTREAPVVGRLWDVSNGAFGGAMGVQSCRGSGGGASVGRIVAGGASAMPSDTRAAALEPCI